jgi:hypothetical protein
MKHTTAGRNKPAVAGQGVGFRIGAKLIETPVRHSDLRGHHSDPAIPGPGSRGGTTGYMSPEQTLSEAVDARSDILVWVYRSMK